MRKNIVIAIVSVIVVIIGVRLLRGDGTTPRTDVWVDNRISASFETSTINETVGEMPATAELHIDASGSMKPYFRAEGAGMINTLSEIVNLNESGTSIYFLDNKKKYTGLVRDILGDINKQPNIISRKIILFFIIIHSFFVIFL